MRPFKIEIVRNLVKESQLSLMKNGELPTFEQYIYYLNAQILYCAAKNETSTCMSFCADTEDEICRIYDELAEVFSKDGYQILSHRNERVDIGGIWRIFFEVSWVERS